MKRYHYKSDPAATSSGEKNPWLIPACIGAGVLGLIAIVSLGTANRSGPSEDSSDATVVEEPLQPSAQVADQQFEPSDPEPGMALGRFSESFDICVGSGRITCVVDGDTFWIQGVKVRVADIDTPEISQPQCDYEKALGTQATHRFMALLNAGPFELHRVGGSDEDMNDRKLRVVVRNGRSLGDQLVSEGLARTWTGRREPWC